MVGNRHFRSKLYRKYCEDTLRHSGKSSERGSVQADAQKDLSEVLMNYIVKLADLPATLDSLDLILNKIVEGDCLELMRRMPDGCVDAVVTDPPYGIAYESNQFGILPRSIDGDRDTSVRDKFLDWWAPRPALVFGTWKAVRPAGTRQVLIWDTLGALGMGALDIPWKPAHQEIYVLGRGFFGERGNDVLRFPPVQSMAYNGRVHPHQKPTELIKALLVKCPVGVVFDPFLGSGTSAIAAKKLGRHFIGCEINPDYCKIAEQRLLRLDAQPELFNPQEITAMQRQLLDGA